MPPHLNIFYSTAHGIFSKIGYILVHKAYLSKYKQIEIIPFVVSLHHAMKIEISMAEEITEKVDTSGKLTPHSQTPSGSQKLFKNF